MNEDTRGDVPVALSNERSQALARLLVWPLLAALLAVTLFLYVVYTPFQIVGASMRPTLSDGDRALRTKTYTTPERGDIVVIDEGTPSDEDDIIKRVIAIPGDRVEIRDDFAVVDGIPEKTRKIIRVEGQGEHIPPVLVPPGHVYVLGDNRLVSLDSRYIGPFPLDRIRGRVVFVFLPPQHFGAPR